MLADWKILPPLLPASIVSVQDMTRLWNPLGKWVAIIRGVIQGAELVEFLIKRVKKVTIFAGTEAISEGLSRKKQMQLVEWLEEKSAVIIKDASPVAVTGKGLIIATKDGQQQLIIADTIAPALPYKPNTDLYIALGKKIPEIYLIGDCMDLWLILDVVAEGWITATSL